MLSEKKISHEMQFHGILRETKLLGGKESGEFFRSMVFGLLKKI